MHITDIHLIKAIVEFFCAFFCLLLGVMLWHITELKSKASRIATLMIGLNIILLICDGLWYIVDGNLTHLDYQVNPWANFLQFVCNPLISLCGILFINSVLQQKGGGLPGWLLSCQKLLLTFAVMLPVINSCYHIMYYIDELNVYHRLNGWYIYTAAMALSLLSALAVIVYQRSRLLTREICCLSFFCLAPVLGMGLQSITSTLPMINLLCTAAIMLMLLGFLYEWLTKLEEGSYTEQKQQKSQILIQAMFMVMLFCLVTAISLMSMSAWVVYREHGINYSQIIAQSAAENVEKNCLKPITIAESMAVTPMLRRAMSQPQLKGTQGEQALLAYLQQIKENTGVELTFAVSGENHGYYINKGYVKDIDTDHKDWYQRAKLSPRKYCLDIELENSVDLPMALFVNVQVRDDQDQVVGLTGVGFSMNNIADDIRALEEEYNVKVYIVDKTGLVQLAANKSDCLHKYLPTDNLPAASSTRFDYHRYDDVAYLIKYFPALDWYMVVIDKKPDKVSFARMMIPGLVVLCFGILLIIGALRIYKRQEKSVRSELNSIDALAKHDGLTGLLNRYALQRLLAMPQDSSWYQNLTIAAIDANGLKPINDTHGHAAGDELIIGVANCLTESLGGHGDIYRIGGDEFVALLHSQPAELPGLLAALKSSCRSWQGELVDSLSISIGTASTWNYSGKELKELISLADQEMYKDKARYYAQHPESDRRNT